MAGEVRRGRRLAATRPMVGYGVAGLALTVAYPFVPPVVGAVVFVAVYVSTMPCVAAGARAVPPGRRLPWILIIIGLAVSLIALVVQSVPAWRWFSAIWLVDAVGKLTLLVAALAFIVRRGWRDLGGIVDASVVALALGGLLWVVVPHRIGLDDSVPAQVDTLVAVFAFCGVLGALVQLSRAVAEPVVALRWLMASLGLGIAGNVGLAVAGTHPALDGVARVLYLASAVAAGLFGLAPDGPRLAEIGTAVAPERLSRARLVFLGAAVALLPVVLGIRAALGNPVDGILLVLQSALVATLVMTRIWLLARQRGSAERALHYLATHDPLTELPNRREFVARLTDELAHDRSCVIMFCDLDGFKLVNDRFGHEAGDRLLIEVAGRLRADITHPHVVSRFGGDEFVVLLVDATSADAQQARSQIATALARPFPPTDGAPLRASIGVSVGAGRCDPEDLIRSADNAMYRAKANRRRTGLGQSSGVGSTAAR